jgi:hypothetical protein
MGVRCTLIASGAALLIATLRGSLREAVADLVGRHRTYMGGLEHGERQLTLRAVERIAAVIRLDPLELLRGR